MIQVAIAGIDTDLGQAIAASIDDQAVMELTGGTTVAEHHTGATRRLATLLDGSNVLVDVTSPQEMMVNAIECLSAGCALVGGAGRLDPNHVAELEEYSRMIPIMYAPDLCLETAALRSLLPLLMDRLPYLEAEITALDSCRRRRRLPDMEIGARDSVVFFSGAGQEIVVSQKVYSQEAPARGAVQAIRFLAGHRHGFFTMDHLLPGLARDASPHDLARLR